MAEPAPQPARLRDTAYSSFTDKLLARDIQPGQIVSQRELVEMTGMPLGAIREMIPRLEADGLIRTAPQRGLQVMFIDMALIRDAFQLRRVIEAEAVADFCRRAEDAAIDRLLHDHETVRAKAQEGVGRALLEEAQHMDWAFHDLVVDHLGNKIISNIYRVNSIKIRLIRNADTRMLPELTVSVMNEHLAVLRALKARDEPAAIAAIHAHIDSAKQRALSI